MSENLPPLDSALVQQFVIAGHGDLVHVQSLLATTPQLINATWDWGNGDWETALGGAAHMGRRDIATYLLTQGARIDLFAAAMLGELAIVQATIAAFPAALDIRGPHGIALITHARKGGEPAAAVVAYLESLTI
jgi:hypothetical protein